MFNQLRLDNRIALVTGASRGLGRSIALGLASAGARVVVNARNADALARVVTEIEHKGGQADLRCFDVTDEEAVKEALASIVTDHRRLDILVNNAGTVVRSPLLESTTEDFRHVVDTNLTSLYVMSREAARLMVPRGYGRIVNIGSVMSHIGRANIVSYVSTKHAVAGLTKALANELAAKGICVNGIGPGYFGTEFNRPLMEDAEFTAMVEGRTPVARWGDPDEIAGAVAYIASDEARSVHGAIFSIDSGVTAG